MVDSRLQGWEGDGSLINNLPDQPKTFDASSWIPKSKLPNPSAPLEKSQSALQVKLNESLNKK